MEASDAVRLFLQRQRLLYDIFRQAARNDEPRVLCVHFPFPVPFRFISLLPFDYYWLCPYYIVCRFFILFPTFTFE